MRKVFFRFVFIIVEIILLALVVILSLYIWRLWQKQVKGIHTVAVIRKEDIILGSASAQLKYFYEPKPDSIQSGKADWLKNVAKYTINSDSLNSFNDFSIQKPDGVLRIITLGDSFTFGQFVSTEDNYPQQLQDLINKTCNKKRFEVINLGVPGYDIQYAIERYRLRGRKYDPDLVIWLVGTGNIYQLNEFMLSENNQKIEKELKANGDFDRMIKQGIFYPVWEKTREEMMKKYGKDGILKLQTQFYSEFRSVYTGPLVLSGFLTEEDRQFLSDLIKADRSTYFFRDITNIYGIPDATLPDRHPSVKGYKIIVQDLFTYLKENNLIPCD